MKLLYLSGFPRSETTDIHDWLLSSPSCCGIHEEQGLDSVERAMVTLQKIHFDKGTAWLSSLFPLTDSLSEEECL